MKTIIIILVLSYCIISVLSYQKFVTTKQLYNGSIGYDGLFKACSKEYPQSIPCRRIDLLNFFWKQDTAISWILDLELFYTCIGYSSDSVQSMGPCLKSGKHGYIMPCSCDMNIPVCCTSN
jgi:hypothetical protein